ncbi:hypothetical protein AC1031_009882 [Aphanomyces cochlioides]|nr:hypothetical protein AC1031_009882 [Aphanomyces cochlioides]
MMARTLFKSICSCLILCVVAIRSIDITVGDPIGDIVSVNIQLSLTASKAPAPKVRSSWVNMDDDDQELYIEAVQLAMDRGYHYYFTQLLEDQQTYCEYYLTTGWAYWNRKILLAYETMLRSLGPKYASVTIPYWDAFADFASTQTSSNCTTLDCAPILSDLGGYKGPVGSLVIDGNFTVGYKVNSSPADHFCESSTTCSKFLIRSNWRRSFPSGFGYFAAAQALNIATNFQNFTSFLKSGMHNNMHLALGAMMANNRTIGDVLFFPLHATLDLMLQIYINCYVGEFPSVETKKNMSNSWLFVNGSVSKPLYEPPNVLSNITHRLPRNYTVSKDFYIDAVNHTVLGPIFQKLPTRYWEYVSASNIGTELSYTYEFNGLLTNLKANMYKCVVNRTNSSRLLGEKKWFQKQIQIARARSENCMTSIAKKLAIYVSDRLDKGDDNEDKTLRVSFIIECLWISDISGRDPQGIRPFVGGVGEDATPDTLSPCEAARVSPEAQIHQGVIANGLKKYRNWIKKSPCRNQITF